MVCVCARLFFLLPALGSVCVTFGNFMFVFYIALWHLNSEKSNNMQIDLEWMKNERTVRIQIRAGEEKSQKSNTNF